MKNKNRTYKKNQAKQSRVSELEAEYTAPPPKGRIYKTIRLFSSFEEENEYVAKERAMLSYDERMMYAEQLRKLVFCKYLLPGGTWPPVDKILTLSKPHI